MEKVKMRRVPHRSYARYGAKSHIEYLHLCKHCQNEYWARKKDGRFCSNACRTLFRIENIAIDKK